MERFPCCLIGCYAVDVGDAEGRCLFIEISSEGEGFLREGYEFVLSCDALVEEEGPVFSFMCA